MNNSKQLIDLCGLPLTSTDLMATRLIVLSTEEQLSDTFDLLNLATFQWLNGEITSKDYLEYVMDSVDPIQHLNQMETSLQCLI